MIPAGVPRKPGMTRDDLFNTNASIVRDLATVVAKESPKAIMAIITNPVNSMVPIASEVLKNVSVFSLIFYLDLGTERSKYIYTNHNTLKTNIIKLHSLFG